MRPPRYRFPDKVRSATRDAAARMSHEGTVAATPEELDAWLAQAPDIREAYEQGGYGSAFTAADVLPLLQAFIARRKAPAPGAVTEPRKIALRTWVLLAAAAVAAALLVVSVLTAAGA